MLAPFLCGPILRGLPRFVIIPMPEAKRQERNARAVSSVGTSACFTRKRSLVQAQYRPPCNPTCAEVAEWQTRYVQGVVSLRAWGFKSPLRHHPCKVPAVIATRT